MLIEGFLTNVLLDSIHINFLLRKKLYDAVANRFLAEVSALTRSSIAMGTGADWPP